jgi:hypothetical protein
MTAEFGEGAIKWHQRMHKGGEGPIFLTTSQVSTRVSSLGEAASFLSFRLSDHWDIYMPTEPDVRGKITKRNGEEKLQILTPKKMTPSYQNYLEYSEGFPQWTVQFNDHENEVFDRGLAWVKLGADTPARFHIGLLAEHGLGESDLHEQLESIPPKITEFIGAVLLNDPSPPYS